MIISRCRFVFLLLLFALILDANGFGLWPPRPDPGPWRSRTSRIIRKIVRVNRYRIGGPYVHRLRLVEPQIRSDVEISTDGGASVKSNAEFNQRNGILSDNAQDLYNNASPCQFSLYDTNGDLQITKDEMNSLYPADIADKLFYELDKSEDGIITVKEFLMAAQVFRGFGCYPDGLPVDFELEDRDTLLDDLDD